MSEHECVTNEDGCCVCLVVQIVKGQLRQLSSLAGELVTLKLAIEVLESPTHGSEHHINVLLDEIVDEAELLVTFIDKYQDNERGKRIQDRLDKIVRKAREIQTS